MSSTADETFVRVAARGDVRPGNPVAVKVGRYEVAIFDNDGEIVAYEDSCPHQGGPISDGYVENGTVTCSWHGWCFNLRTGSMTLGDFANLRRFSVRLTGDAIEIATEPDPE
jgi:nitrite reductase (NADH) small subunit/3-phenylpropionate/trans-cinnamate dioxygenase ferredoxin subunit